ncbi:hypothetical protein E2P81_ATG05712 [Venturia nashicola]|uniref:Serine/threonine-protein kinase Tel1 n=1 Tax=Venturia nashicola TaxID=86259 RepID=A0A4Z1P3T7_9PEZI|nr:hypothetical protein E6O75_ATG05851 [Venturia nashicola]TLD29418.1 hypothetical protein E2P81_ATG05712 [Venturia nashicola]
MSGRKLVLEEVLGRIQSSSKPERKDGLADLEHLFKHNKNSPTLDSLKDKTWHTIFDALFACAATERSLYLKTNASVTKATALKRLEECGRALRTVVTAGVRKLRAKTVKALIHHIIQTLPLPGEQEFFEGFSQPYVKCLSIICEYQPHVEHLKTRSNESNTGEASRQPLSWQDVVEFCIDSIAMLQDQAAPEPSPLPNSNGPSLLRTSTLSISRRPRDGTPQPARSQRSSAIKPELDDMVICLHHLTRATNAPVPGMAEPILSTLIQYLRASEKGRSSLHFAFAAINSVLSKVGSSSIDETHAAISELYPVIKELWQSRIPILKEEMLITLILTRNHVSNILSLPNHVNFAADVENVFEVLQADYSRRLERDQLQLNDLNLTCASEFQGSSFLVLPSFQLSVRSLHSENQWSVLHLMAYYMHLLDSNKKRTHERSDQNGLKDAKKRRRPSYMLSDIIRQVTTGINSSRISALQTISFYTSLSRLNSGEIIEILDSITPMLADQHGPTSSWAMVAIVSIASQKTARDAELSTKWLNLFNLASRKVATPSTCRAASFLLSALLRLNVLSYASVASIVETMLSSVDLQGPVTFCDSSAMLWITFMKAKAAENPSASATIPERIIRWLFGRWIPSNFDIKRYAVETAANCRPGDILDVLDACSERDVSASSAPPFFCHGKLAQAWQRVASLTPLTEYILLSKEEKDFLHSNSFERPHSFQGHLASQTSLAADMQILDSCSFETERVLAKWSEWMEEKSQKLLPEMMVTVASLCIVNDILISRQSDRHKVRTDALRKSNETLNKSITAFLALPECDQENVDAILALTAGHLPGIRFLQSADESQEIMPFALHLSRALDLRKTARNSIAKIDDDDLMDIDDGFDSQMSDKQSSDAHEIAARDSLTMGSDLFSFRSCVTAYVQLITTAFQSKLESIEDSQGTVPSRFIGYLTSLAPSEFCACRPLLRLLLSSQTSFLVSDVDTLFDHLAAEFLEVYDYERHEVTLSIILDLLQGCAGQWTDTQSESLRELAVEAYTWFINVALPGDICSTDVQLGISDLFFTLLQARGPDFKPDPTLPSIRTGLFKLLATADISIKFHISQNIALFFGHFTLGEHEAVFDDVHKSLPVDENWKEGMAVRLFVLSRLGSQWSTLLRRCIYHIYETAGLIAGCGGHATFCVNEITKSLRLSSPQELFRLFSSQLLYTWLSRSPINDIPFSVFNYSSLQSLIEDVEDEIYSQVLMRGDDAVLVTLAGLLKSNNQHLLAKNFGKSAGYCLAWDTDKNSQGQHPAETKLRAMFDKASYTSLCRQHLSSIIGTFIYTIDEEPQMMKILTKRTTAAHEVKALKAMQDFSSSTQTLPADQQPLFRSKFLLDRIDRLARRVNIDLSMLWTPAVYTFVLRMLLNKIHPALGSLHACSVVRKIRVLVALSGAAAFSGYPLEMTLHALRPFFTDKQCAEDAIGIAQFLFSNGLSHLKNRISFVSGILVSTLVSLRKFVGSSQESTTQESQHRATMGKAQHFRTWLVNKWMPEYANQFEKNDSKLHACTILVTATAKANAAATSMTECEESNAVLRLLKDRRAGFRLLQKPAWDLAFNLMCSDFVPSISYRNDILGDDSVATSLASVIWESCKQPNISKGYLLWAARVLGRAHLAAGLNSNIVGGSHMVTRLGPKQETSKASILQALSDSLQSSNANDVGLAEETIRTVLLRTTSREEIAEHSEILSASITEALTLDTTEDAVALKPPEYAALDSCIADTKRPVEQWLQTLTISLAYTAGDDPLAGALPRILAGVTHLSRSLFAPVLHLELERDYNEKQETRRILSEGFRQVFRGANEQTLPHVKALLTALLYLHKQPIPQETSTNDRIKWLDVDYAVAAEAAEKCSMYVTALRFAEQASPPAVALKASRRSSILTPAPVPDSLLLSIYKNIDEPDSFYGVQQTPDLSSVLDRLEYEADGFKGLIFRGARLDSQMRRHVNSTSTDTGGLIRSLINLNLNALPHNLLSNQREFAGGISMADSVLYTARKLEQWDIRAPETSITEAGTLFSVFQGISNSRDSGAIKIRLDRGFLGTMEMLLSPIHSGQSVKSCLRALGVLVEVDDAMSATSANYFRDAWKNMQKRSQKMLSSKREDVYTVLSSRETLFSTVCNNASLREAMKLSLKDARSIEVEALLSSCHMSRKHNSLQGSLATATYLSELSEMCSRVGLDIQAAAQNEVADALWDQGEYSTSIRMLRRLVAIPAAQLENATGQGHHVGEARLEQPDQIMTEYLAPAIAELGSTSKGNVAGQVFHQYASFCDAQLHDPDLLAEFDRIHKMRETRTKEIEHWKGVSKSTRDRTLRDKVNKDFRKASRWLQLDDKEYMRLRDARESFMMQSLENYIFALMASDAHDNDVLRLFALWLEFAESELANTSVGKNLDKVPTGKFVRLMNQLSSRLQDEKTPFQELLTGLVYKIAVDHPYHAMHHISAGSSAVDGKASDSAKSRMKATTFIANKLQSGGEDTLTSKTWQKISLTDRMYHDLAVLHDGKDHDTIFRAGRDLALNDFREGKNLTTKVPGHKLPPPTMDIPVRPDKNYSRVPIVTGFQPKMRIANGLSAPKIVVAQCSDGHRFKQLFKKADDLRQDAIMEQVFEEVSRLLSNHTTTRQRNLRIRTYKVLPLTSNSGIMEFVQNTRAFHDVLLPLHATHFPKDLKSSVIRSRVDKTSSRSIEERVKVFRDSTDHFNPAMRFFFLEQYLDPEVWFEKRIAYTRSTAAISILGHVVGLGDRHLHNILLDEQSGEVVHIDLGVAFEAGRVLPIPEVVPFRLSRDIVDGMGYTKTEGVFRRCCEFTLDALREEREGIMTLLNVLRYDPLYTWSVSPLKAKKLQEEDGDEGGDEGGAVDFHGSGRNSDDDDAGEAGRALTIVEKKLSKTLSTAATVSELISQATDERNLAVLFAGWSAWV